ncbi:hypothetical protein KJ365_05060 [Glaciecola sp. XM2]|jgi:hypothetical protein|uniref:hypothetical protein n=1 Tax=Glaciecola sp. XM2 TaxID=1914931 RepID=UPI001BDF4FB0|nr:hypothetical protein [Glaciecola sp. XM2]MBT1450241.1 hypothetical protein [Glaciecola sp. XM2]
MAAIRLLASAAVAFIFYSAWAFYANSLVTQDQAILVKAALVQGIYSSAITLFFSILLEFFHARLAQKGLCLTCIIPCWFVDDRDHPSPARQSIQSALEKLRTKFKGNEIPGMLIVPLPALLIQSVLVIAINVIFATPNLWLTVAPSIFFSGLYGYSYSIALSRRQMRANVTNS